MLEDAIRILRGIVNDRINRNKLSLARHAAGKATFTRESVIEMTGETVAYGSVLGLIDTMMRENEVSP